MRIEDLDLLRHVVTTCKIDNLDPEKWVAVDTNVMLTDDNGNIALFEKYRPETFAIHLCMKQRGKEALVSATQLKEEFLNEFKVKFLTGLIREDNKKAIWFASRLGSKPYGIVDTISGRCQFVIFTV